VLVTNRLVFEPVVCIFAEHMIAQRMADLTAHCACLSMGTTSRLRNSYRQAPMEGPHV